MDLIGRSVCRTYVEEVNLPVVLVEHGTVCPSFSIDFHEEQIHSETTLAEYKTVME